MNKQIVTPKEGKVKVLGYCSGSGNTLWKAYELQQKIQSRGENCPFEVVGIFADDPDSKAVRTAEEYGVKHFALSIRDFYEERNKPLKDREVRAEYDMAAMEMIKELGADMILLAGYVWATTDVLLDNYTVAGVHPGDLAVQDANGRRLLAGANGVKSAFKENMSHLRSSSYIATKEIDGGPILIRSPKIPVDYAAHTDEDERFRHYLKLINDQGRYVGARTVLELALGNFEYDENGKLLYKGEPAPFGICFEEWEKDFLD